MLAVAEGVPLTHRRRSHKLPKLNHQHAIRWDVGKRKRRLTATEKAAKKRRRAEFRTVFINGKQKRVRRPPTIDGVSVDEFIRSNADPIFLHEMEIWELMEQPRASDGADGMPECWRGKHAARHPELTMIVQPAGDMFLARCPELGIWSRGYTAEDARANLAEDVELFFEGAEESEEPAT
jgi:predicted RNase H-like HicB family nuclease